MFEIGAQGPDQWPGVSKLLEEMGELTQILGKLIATRGQSEHWSGLNLREELIKEIADVHAAICFVMVECLSSEEIAVIQGRIAEKIKRFNRWHELGQLNQEVLK